MKDQIQIFEHKEFGKLEVLLIGGKPYFPATECATTLGYATPRHAISRHCPHVLKRAVGVQTGVKSDGSPATQTIEKQYIPEGDLYRLIIRSKLPAAVRFEAFVCDEVLPSIRAHGAYITEDVLRKLREDRDFADELMGRLADEQAKNLSLLNYMGRIKPKVQYCDAVLQSPYAVPVSVIAKDYSMSAAPFNQLLHTLGVQYRVGKTWLLYKDFAGQGYTISKTYLIGGAEVSVHTCWTQKGRLFLYEFLKWYGILPDAEKI